MDIANVFFTFKLNRARDIRKIPKDQNVSVRFFQINLVKTLASLKYLNIVTVIFSVCKDVYSPFTIKYIIYPFSQTKPGYFH